MKIDPENRRSFVKKSLATSMSVSFAGLIRAHGDGGSQTTTFNPENTYVTTSGGTTTTFDQENTFFTTIGNSTTWNPEVAATTEATTEPPIPSEEEFKIKIEMKEVIEMDQDTFTYIFGYSFSFEKPLGFDEDERERSDDFVALEKGNPTDDEEPNHEVADVGSIKITKINNNDIKYWAKLGWQIKTKIQIPNDAQPLHVNRDCLKATASASIKLTIKEVIEDWTQVGGINAKFNQHLSKNSPSLTRGVEATAIKKSTPVEDKPNKLEALVRTGDVEGADESPAGDVVVKLAATVAPAGDANSKTVTWTKEMVSAWADSVDNIKDTIKTIVDELIDEGLNPQDYQVDVILVKPVMPRTVRTQSVRAFFAPWVKIGAGCNI